MEKTAALDKVKELYNRFADTNEETIKNNVVRYMLEVLGYDPLDFYYENPSYHKNSRTDIAVQIDNQIQLYVEVKRPELTLGSKEIEQLANNLYSRKLSWGILTNGRTYMLINNDIDPLPNFERPVISDKVIFEIDVFNDKSLNYVGYFSKESIFETEISNYFKDIMQFKAYRFPDNDKSWTRYWGTLSDFFQYYADSQRHYLPLEQIRVNEFERYLLDYRKGKEGSARNLNSESTFNAKYSHIRSFYHVLYENNYIKSHNFSEPKSRLIDRLRDHMVETKEANMLNGEDIKKALELYDRDTVNGLRRKTIFLLSLYGGFTRDTIHNIKEEMFKGENIYLDNRVIPLPPKIMELIKELKKQKKILKIKDPYIFHTRYKGQYLRTSTSSINGVFKSLETIGLHNITLTTIRNNLVKQMFVNNYSIEEISYVTGMELHHIGEIISWEGYC